MNQNFRDIEGGLFSRESGKADVGDVAARIAEMGAANMAWADPFYPDPSTPPHVLRAAVEELERGTTSHYTAPIGNMELKKAIAKKLKSYNGLDADPLRNIIITPGSDAGLLFAMMPFISPGDEIMVPDPSYPSNFLNPRLLGGVTVPVPLEKANGYQPDIQEFKKRLTPKTKMILISHPNNPTATVFRRNALEALCQFIVENDLVLVCDQAFEDMIYDGIEFVTPASLPHMFERTVTTFSVSKGMGLSGFRIGYNVACDRVMDVFHGSAVNVVGASNTAAQTAVLEAFRDNSFLKDYTEKLDKRRKAVYKIFSNTPGVVLKPAESGFLSWLDISAIGESGEIVQHLIEHARVLVNDGSFYGAQGRGHIRVVHGCFWEDEQALDACMRISAALADKLI